MSSNPTQLIWVKVKVAWIDSCLLSKKVNKQTKKESNDQFQLSHWQLKKIRALKPNGSTWMDFSPLFMNWVSREEILPRPIRWSLWPSVLRLSSSCPILFPILLSMRWHFYPPIKTFKGPLSKRKECCFNSVVAPFLGPFFSARIHPAPSSSLKFTIKEGTFSPVWAVEQQMNHPFTAPCTQTVDYKPLACLPLLQLYCFSFLSTCFFSSGELVVLCWRTCGVFGCFVWGLQELAIKQEFVKFSFMAQLLMLC